MENNNNSNITSKKSTPPKLTDKDINQILKEIEKILKSDAKIDSKNNKFVIDDRIHNIRQLISKINKICNNKDNKQLKKQNNKFRVKLVDLIIKHIQQIEEKENTNTENSLQNELLKKANRIFLIRLLKYISSTLKTYPSTNPNIIISEDNEYLNRLIKEENATVNIPKIIKMKNQ